MALYRVHGHVSSHVAGRDPVQHGGPSQGPQALGGHVEDGPEQRHLRPDQVGEGDGGVDVAAADVADGLDEGGSREPKAQGHMENIVSAAGPAQGGPHAEEHEEHGPEELCEDRPPKIHGAELPHVDRWLKHKQSNTSG